MRIIRDRSWLATVLIVGIILLGVGLVRQDWELSIVAGIGDAIATSVLLADRRNE